MKIVGNRIFTHLLDVDEVEPISEIDLRGHATEGHTPEPMDVAVFDPDEVEDCGKRLEHTHKGRVEGSLTLAASRGGYRTIPHIQPANAIERLDALEAQFPNFSAAIDYLRSELGMSITGGADNWRLSPILFSGPPGVGKTHFAKSLAEAFDFYFRSMQMGSQNGAFALAGSQSWWANSQPGIIFDVLANQSSAAPVLLLDEIDKSSGDERYGTVDGALHDLLEVSTARTFRDESLQMPMDASHITLIATTNRPELLSDAILSRVHVVDIPAPTIDQLREIAATIAYQELDLRDVHILETFFDRLIELTHDLRQIRRLCRSVLGKALLSARGTVGPEDLPRPARVRVSIGFHANVQGPL